MSDEIKVNPSIVDDAITDMRTSIEALEASFAREIQGDNNLDMVDSFNELKIEYEELLTQYKALFLNNIQSTEESVASIRKLEQDIASKMGTFIKDGLSNFAK